VGSTKKNSHVIVPIQKCYIEDERCEPILDALKILMKIYQVLPYDEMSGTAFCATRSSRPLITTKKSWWFS
jgi:tRNA/tmRNA/rRNA uracil-C5-methylase (TrmA/RlmC/RlmD family)